MQNYFGSDVALYLAYSKLVLFAMVLGTITAFIWRVILDFSRDDLENILTAIMFATTGIWEIYEMYKRRHWKIVFCQSVWKHFLSFLSIPRPFISLPLLGIFVIIDVTVVIFCECLKYKLGLSEYASYKQVGSLLMLCGMLVTGIAYNYLAKKVLTESRSYSSQTFTQKKEKMVALVGTVFLIIFVVQDFVRVIFFSRRFCKRPYQS